MRHITIQAKRPDGKRTSVSIHSYLYERVLKNENFPRKQAVDDLHDYVRLMIRKGYDSWQITANLIHYLATCDFPYIDDDVTDFTGDSLRGHDCA